MSRQQSEGDRLQWSQRQADKPDAGKVLLLPPQHHLFFFFKYVKCCSEYLTNRKESQIMIIFLEYITDG